MSKHRQTLQGFMSKSPYIPAEVIEPLVAHYQSLLEKQMGQDDYFHPDLLPTIFLMGWHSYTSKPFDIASSMYIGDKLWYQNLLLEMCEYVANAHYAAKLRTLLVSQEKTLVVAAIQLFEVAWKDLQPIVTAQADGANTGAPLVYKLEFPSVQESLIVYTGVSQATAEILLSNGVMGAATVQCVIHSGVRSKESGIPSIAKTHGKLWEVLQLIEDVKDNWVFRKKAQVASREVII